MLKNQGQVLRIMRAKLDELHKRFVEACVYEYVDDAKEKDHEYRNPRDTWFMKGLAKGAAWACVGLEDRMMEEP